MAGAADEGPGAGPVPYHLVGVAIYNHGNSRQRGYRVIYGGARVRSALYTATLGALRWNPVLREFYGRLLDAGKLKKVALVAFMYKLLRILKAMVKNGPRGYLSADRRNGTGAAEKGRPPPASTL